MKSSDSRCRASIAVEHHEAKKLSNKDSFFCFCGGAGGIRTLVQTWDMLRFLHA